MLVQSVIARDRDGNQWLQVTDATVALLHPAAALAKQDLELLQLDRYRALVATDDATAFEMIEQGDRPDFWIERGGRKIGLDVAALAFNERRGATAQFRLVRNRLRDEYRAGRLRPCRGINVLLRFSAANIPRPERLENELQELAEALERLEPDRYVWATLDGNQWVDGKVPTPFPMGESGRTSNGSIEWYVSGLCAINNSFSIECGLNIEHAYQATVTAPEIKKRLDEIVAQHDKRDQCIEELVIIAGGPDRYGEAVVDEAMIASVFVDTWEGVIEAPRNVQRVVLLNWLSNTTRVLYDRSGNARLR